MSALSCVAMLGGFLFWGFGMMLAGRGWAKWRAALAHRPDRAPARIASAKDRERIVIEGTVESADEIEATISRARVACASGQLDTLAFNTVPEQLVRRRRTVSPDAITITDGSGRAVVVIGAATSVLCTPLVETRLTERPLEGPIADLYVPWPDDSYELGESSPVWVCREMGLRQGERVSIEARASVSEEDGAFRGGARVTLADRPGEPMRITNLSGEAVRAMVHAARRELIAGVVLTACATATFAWFFSL